MITEITDSRLLRKQKIREETFFLHTPIRGDLLIVFLTFNLSRKIY